MGRNQTGWSLESSMSGPPSPVIGPVAVRLGKLSTRKSPLASLLVCVLTVVVSLGGCRRGAETKEYAPLVVNAPIGAAACALVANAPNAPLPASASATIDLLSNDFNVIVVPPMC